MSISISIYIIKALFQYHSISLWLYITKVIYITMAPYIAMAVYITITIHYHKRVLTLPLLFSGYIFQCNFESSNSDASLCGMQQDTSDTSGFEWMLQTGSTKSEFTGPNNAFSSPFYIYMEASRPRNAGDRAR